MTHRLIIAAGGSGGHLFPAMRLATNLLETWSDLSILFVGDGLSHSAYFDRSRFAYREVASSPWRGIHPKALWQLCYRNGLGVIQAKKHLRAFTPTAAIGFGSYHTLPAMIAMWRKKIPFFLYEANTIPGKINTFFSRYAHTTAVQFPDATKFLQGWIKQVSLIGSSALVATSTCMRAKAILHYGLDPDLPILLVAGGSQGALAVNSLVVQALSPPPYPLQVIHLAGRQAPLEEYVAAYSFHGIPACVLPFEEDMQLAWIAADLFIGRSGASIISELLQTRTPALLIPYPWSSDHHQEHNARFFTDVVGGGMLCLQSKTTPQHLHRTIARALHAQMAEVSLWKTSIDRYLHTHRFPSLHNAVVEFLNHVQNH